MGSLPQIKQICRDFEHLIFFYNTHEIYDPIEHSDGIFLVIFKHVPCSYSLD
jgi:hypothetical protein